MQLRLSFFLFLAATLFSLNVAAAEREFRDVKRLSLDRASRIDEVVQELMRNDEAVGIALGIIRKGQVVYLKGYGLADAELDLPVTRRTMFRWASVSKLLTATAAMQLYEKSELELDRDIRHYVPEFPDHGHKITARDLLCHQSGIVHYSNGEVVKTIKEYDIEHPFTDVVTALDSFNQSRLLFAPGERFSYTTHGYILLSAVVQRASNVDYVDQIAQRIAKPAGMTTLQPDYQWVQIPHRAVGYRKPSGKIVQSEDSDVSWKLGGGGYISNIGDMAKFARGLINGEFVSPQTESLMWTRQLTRSGKETTYGLGFGISGQGDDLKVFHSGAQPKTKTRLAIYPRRGLGVVVASNSEWVKPAVYTTRVLDVLRAAQVPANSN